MTNRPRYRPRYSLQNRLAHCVVATGFAACAAASGLHAQENWPSKPIRVELPFPPGGPSDISMRLAAEKIQAVLKQTLVIDNKPGAGGNLGAAEMARAGRRLHVAVGRRHAGDGEPACLQEPGLQGR